MKILHSLLGDIITSIFGKKLKPVPIPVTNAGKKDYRSELRN